MSPFLLSTLVTEIVKKYDQLYVGFQSRPETDPNDPKKSIKIVLGFATPYEKNSAGAKRMKTVDNWATSTSMDPTATKKNGGGLPDEFKASKLIDNEPLEGFKIGGDIARMYWGGGNVVWRICDPRGFQLEISSSNLGRIIATAGVNAGGEIPGKCVWCRVGGVNVLVPENSDTWQKMLEDSKKLDSNQQLITTKDVAPGDEIDSKIGPAIFLGRVYVVVSSQVIAKGQKRYSYGVDETREFKTVGPYYAMRGIDDDGKVRRSSVVLYKDSPVIRVTTAGKYLSELPELLKVDPRQIHFASNSPFVPLAMTDQKENTVAVVAEPVDPATLGLNDDARITTDPSQHWEPSAGRNNRRKYSPYRDVDYRLVTDHNSELFGTGIFVEFDTAKEYAAFRDAFPYVYDKKVWPSDLPPRDVGKLVVRPTGGKRKDTLANVPETFSGRKYTGNTWYTHRQSLRIDRMEYFDTMNPAEYELFKGRLRDAFTATPIYRTAILVNGERVVQTYF